MKIVSVLLAFGMLCSTICEADLALDQSSTTKTVELNNETPLFVPESGPIAVQESSDKADTPGEGIDHGAGGWVGVVPDIGSGGWGGDVAGGGSGGSGEGIDHGSGGWTGVVADGGSGGWTGDIAGGGSGGSGEGLGVVADGGTGGWTGDIADGGTGK